MIPVFLDEISTRSVGTDFTLRLHEEIEFHPGKTGQFSRRGVKLIIPSSLIPAFPEILHGTIKHNSNSVK